MSSQPNGPDAIAEFQAFETENYMVYVTVVLVVYEYLITIRQEVSMIWRWKRTGATWLFLANRYLMILNMVLGIVPSTSQTCRGILLALDTVGMMQYTVFALFSALRVYALWDRNLVIFLVILALNMVIVFVQIYSYTLESIIYFVDPVIGIVCTASYKSPNLSGLFFHLALISRLSIIVGDVLVIVLTWVRTFRQQGEAIRLRMNAPFSGLLLRDGTLYFIALLVMNLANILVKDIPAFNSAEPVQVLQQTLTPILISRFLLNLRDTYDDGSQTLTANHGSVAFRAPSSFIGNMGELLDHTSTSDNYTLDAEVHELEETKQEAGFEDQDQRENAPSGTSEPQTAIV